MELYLATAPEGLETALSVTNHIAHALCRIGPGSTLLARPLPEKVRGGLVLVSDREAPEVTEPEQLAQALAALCRARHFAGAVLDFEGPVRQDLARFIQVVDEAFFRAHLELCRPEKYTDRRQNSSVFLSASLSGGQLEERLREAVERYGGEKLALDLERLRMDFPLPCPSGQGVPLTEAELRERLAGRAVHFSQALCARYGIYFRQGQGRLVLFDDAQTLERKIALAEHLGIRRGFVMLPETEDLLPQLFAGQKEKS